MAADGDQQRRVPKPPDFLPSDLPGFLDDEPEIQPINNVDADPAVIGGNPVVAGGLAQFLNDNDSTFVPLRKTAIFLWNGSESMEAARQFLREKKGRSGSGHVMMKGRPG